uniref:Aminotransferase class I/classII large domain-containing protein n=1 Tax=Vannella robusta TaxID=1487602 RepID=A0A6U1WWM6_9EUKA|mmetsp:Transcript_5378/g.6540  ORF Transcript_5378/g.6540 Transcript_5378/m.6540 type:complete len:390 (+) Transcript_5378:147-1316(+)
MSFPANDIIALLEVPDDIRFNLGESTSLDLKVSDITTLSESELTTKLSSLNLGYGSARGTKELCKLIAEDANRTETENLITEDDVVVTIGAVSSLFLVSFLLCSPQRNDECLIVSPNFPAAIDGLIALGVTVNFLSSKFENKYQLDMDEFAVALNENTKLVSIPSPGNPSGVCVPLETIQKMVEIMKEKAPAAYLLVDETYREALLHEDDSVGPSASVVSDKVISLSSLSKAVGAPGLRIGWMICRDKTVIQKIIVAKMNILICCPTMEEFFSIELFKKKQELLDRQREHLSKNFELLKQWMEEHSSWLEWVQPDRGALCCAALTKQKFPSEDSVTAFYDACKQHKLMVGRGSWFREDDRRFRVGFGYLEYEEFKLALYALSAALQASS